MIDDVMQSPLLNVVVQRHMRDLTKDVAAPFGVGSHSCCANFGECAGAECLSSSERILNTPLAALQQQQNVVCVSSPCPSCFSLVHQLRRQVAELQAAAASHGTAWPLRPPFSHAAALSSFPPPVNSSHMTIRCIDGRTVQVRESFLPVPAARPAPMILVNHPSLPSASLTLLPPPTRPSHLARFIFRTTLRRNAAVCMLLARQMREIDWM
jgi:hypothetical protein